MAEIKAIQSYLDESLVTHWVEWCDTFLSTKLNVSKTQLNEFSLSELISFTGSDIPSRAAEFYRLGLLKHSISLKGDRTLSWKKLNEDESVITHFGYIVYCLVKSSQIDNENLKIKKGLAFINTISVLRQNVIIGEHKISLNSVLFKAIKSFDINYSNTYLYRQYLFAAILSSLKINMYEENILRSFETNSNIDELVIKTIDPDEIRETFNKSDISIYLEETLAGNLKFENIPNQRLSNFYVGNFKRNHLRGAFNSASLYFYKFLEVCYYIDQENFRDKPFDRFLNEENDPIISLILIFREYKSHKNTFEDTMKTLIEGIEEALRLLKVDDCVTNGNNFAKNKIYFGPPGTGKSHAIKEELKKLGAKGDYYSRVTFHPDYDYHSFVGGYKPFTDTEDDDKIKYKFVPQVFTDLYVKAWSNTSEDYYLVIEEINRGNCAEIFGDIFQLLDRNPEYNIEPSTELRAYLEEYEKSNNVKLLFDGKLQMPNNLSILASMNTSDQSLYPMDSAFKRRWDWHYVPIDLKCTESNFTIKIDDTHQYSWLEFLAKVNDKIYSVTKSEDKQIGNWFINASKSENIISKELFINKVLFYLWNDVFKDEVFNPDNIFIERNTDGTKNRDISFNNFYNKDEQDRLLIHLLSTILNVPLVVSEVKETIQYSQDNSETKIAAERNEEYKEDKSESEE